MRVQIRTGDLRGWERSRLELTLWGRLVVEDMLKDSQTVVTPIFAKPLPRFLHVTGHHQGIWEIRVDVHITLNGIK